MSDIDLSSPILSYVGAVDISSENQGKTLYNILFDSTLNTLANVLMFEYKLQAANIEHATNTNVEFGYIEHSNFHSGIVNQWQISVPSRNHSYNPTVDMNIQVRVYAGVINSSNVVVTEWSNPLKVHNPPNKPVFFDDVEPTAMYDIGYGSNQDDLYVFLEPDNEINYDDVKFLVAYYYTNNNDETVWDVSDQITAQEIIIDLSYNAMMLKVSNFGKVSTSLQSVYVSVYSVYKFSDASDNSFYSVSEVTDIKIAEPANYFTQPTLSSNAITYHIYDEEPEQRMSIAWSAPFSTYLPIYYISRYVLEVTTDDPENPDANWTVINSNITNTTYDFDTPVDDYPCGTTLSFRVQAIDENDNTSPYSAIQSINMFKYSEAPQNLSVTETSDGVDMTVHFSKPEDIGCGNGYKYIIIVDGYRVHEVDYDINQNSYDISLTNLDVNSSGIVEVFLETYNTNNNQGSSTLEGAHASVPYIAYNLSLNSIVYDVYSDRTSQNMILEWNAINANNWTIVNYSVEKSTNEPVSFENIEDVNLTSYTYDASTNDKNDSLSFRIKANMQYSYNSSLYTYTIISNTQSINVFKFASAPQNLSILNTTTDGSNLTSITISFDEPSDIGSGTSYQYVIDVSGLLYYIGHQSSIEYTINVNSNIGLSGTVSVLLQTENTNNDQGPSYLDGDVSSLPFASSNISLYEIVYDVYDDKTTQNMELSWSGVSIDEWGVDYYSVMIKVNSDSDYTEVTQIENNTTYNYSSSSHDCDTLLHFKIVAHMVSNDGNTTYEIESNVQSINIFKYATDPEQGIVNWCVADIDVDTGLSENIKLNINFKNSSTRGCGSAIHYVVEVTDVNNNIIGSDTVEYNASLSSNSWYEVNFDIDTYTPSGHVNIYLVTIDTNDERELEGVYKVLDYVTSQLPYYINQTVETSNLFSFSVITQTQLLPNATLAYQYTGESKNYVDWKTILTNTPESQQLTNNGVSIVRTLEDNGEYKYTIKMTAQIINKVKLTNYTELPQWFAISVSNSAGVGTDITIRS